MSRPPRWAGLTGPVSLPALRDPRRPANRIFAAVYYRKPTIFAKIYNRKLDKTSFFPVKIHDLSNFTSAAGEKQALSGRFPAFSAGPVAFSVSGGIVSA